MTDSPYLFRATDHPLAQRSPFLKMREGVSPFGSMAVRYQERAPGGPEAKILQRRASHRAGAGSVDSRGGAAAPGSSPRSCRWWRSTVCQQFFPHDST